MAKIRHGRGGVAMANRCGIAGLQTGTGLVGVRVVKLCGFLSRARLGFFELALWYLQFLPGL